jgi:hypothetical protein
MALHLLENLWGFEHEEGFFSRNTCDFWYSFCPRDPTRHLPPLARRADRESGSPPSRVPSARVSDLPESSPCCRVPSFWPQICCHHRGKRCRWSCHRGIGRRRQRCRDRRVGRRRRWSGLRPRYPQEDRSSSVTEKGPIGPLPRNPKNRLLARAARNRSSPEQQPVRASIRLSLLWPSARALLPVSD